MTGDFLLVDLCEALDEDVRELKSRGRGVEYLATHFDVSPQTVYAWLEGRRPFPLLRMAEWKRTTGGDHAARWVANQLGLAWVPMPDSTSVEVNELAEVVESQSVAVVTALKIYADSKVDRAEANGTVPMCIAQLRRAIESQLALIERLECDAAAAKAEPKTMAQFERERVAK